jgi:hypothetical protein
MVNHSKWPQTPNIAKDDPQAEVKKLLYQAQLDALKAEAQVNIDRQKADWEHEYALDHLVYNAYIEVAKGQVERARAGADFVQKTAAAISSAYVAILGLSFVAAKTPLPVRGIAPTFFLGLSIFLAAAYLAYITKPQEVESPNLGSNNVINQIERRRAFIRWVTSAVISRKYFLQTSIISLGFGVFFLPAPYLNLSDNFVLTLIVISLLLTFLIPALLKA